MNAFRYFLSEASASLWRGKRAGVLSIVTIAAALFVLGGFLLVTTNLQRLLAEHSRTIEMSVYLHDQIAEPDRALVERALASDPLVAGREYVSKTDALGRFGRDFSDLADVAGSFAENPFPASYEVTLTPGAREGDRAARLASTLAAMSGVADVRYDRHWIERVTLAIALLNGVGALVVGVLVLAAAVTVANVVRLACYARRDEIEIMQLVGAPLLYVRGPFVVEGILQGGIGALVALSLLAGAFAGARVQVARMAGDLVGLGGLQFLPLGLCAWVIAGGMLVGCVGGFIAARSAS